MPVPAPAVARLLQNAPTQLGPQLGELTTPTGAALLRGFDAQFAEAPAGCILASGYGAGTKDFPKRANTLQAMLIDSAACVAKDDIIQLACNLDDITGEALGFLSEKLMKAGAVDVTLIPVTMKKGRPGIKLEVMCSPDAQALLTEILLTESTTFGVRYQHFNRTILKRKTRNVQLQDIGEVAVKFGYHPDSGKLLKAVPEYESCKTLAEQSGRPFAEVYQLAQAAARQSKD